jgi:hypothetical protein
MCDVPAQRPAPWAAVVVAGPPTGPLALGRRSRSTRWQQNKYPCSLGRRLSESFFGQGPLQREEARSRYAAPRANEAYASNHESQSTLAPNIMSLLRACTVVVLFVFDWRWSCCEADSRLGVSVTHLPTSSPNVEPSCVMSSPAASAKGKEKAKPAFKSKWITVLGWLVYNKCGFRRPYAQNGSPRPL